VARIGASPRSDLGGIVKFHYGFSCSRKDGGTVTIRALTDYNVSDLNLVGIEVSGEACQSYNEPVTFRATLTSAEAAGLHRALGEWLARFGGAKP